jgi:antitoxin VapB
MPSLSIKNEEACRLERELAELRGESMTAVVIEAVRENLERDRKAEIDHARVEYFLQVGREVRATADPDWLARDLTAELYDEELGLPI